MSKIINKIFSILKYILLIGSFVLTFFVIMTMYQRLKKNYMGTIDIFVPYVLLLVVFTINLLKDQEKITGNLIYNLTCCLVLGTSIFCGYRAIFDKYLLSGVRLGYDIDFNYFSDFIAPFKSMMYLLIFSNIGLMFGSKKKSKPVEEVKPIAEKVN